MRASPSGKKVPWGKALGLVARLEAVPHGQHTTFFSQNKNSPLRGDHRGDQLSRISNIPPCRRPVPAAFPNSQTPGRSCGLYRGLLCAVRVPGMAPACRARRTTAGGPHRFPANSSSLSSKLYAYAVVESTNHNRQQILVHPFGSLWLDSFRLFPRGNHI